MTQRDAQRRIQALLDEAVSTGAEIGVQVAVIKDGQLVVDAVSGLADPGTGALVSSDTLFYAASTAKGVATSVAHVLAEQGALDYDMPLVKVWPEFGAHGKDTVTVRHVLLHTAGLPGLPANTMVADLCNWDHMCAVLADATPWWEPGTRFGYHAKTFGFLLGETLRRATGRTIPALLRDLITGPLGIADDVHFGVPPSLLPRVARQVATADPAPPPPPGSALARAIPRGVLPDAEYANRTEILNADIPSEGTMTARGVARLYAALLGDIPGISLVSPQRRTAMAAIAFTGMDEVMGFPVSWAFGYSPDRPGGVTSRTGSPFGMVGTNGSAAFADIDAGVAVAVMRNRFVAGDLTTVSRVDHLVAETLG
jgi:CubicO group peptidase (beta-lactamase class C family)